MLSFLLLCFLGELTLVRDLSVDLEAHDVFPARLSHPLIAATAEGQMIVGDQEGCRLLFFDREGRLLRTIGKRGQGPGEFQRIDMVCVADGLVHVWDGASRRMSRLDLTGAYQGTHDVREMLRQPLVSDGGRLYFVRRDNLGSDLFYQLRANGDGVIRDRIGAKGPSAVMMVWVPRMEFGARGDAVVCNMGQSRAVQWQISADQPVRSFEHELPVIPVSDEFYDGEMRRLQQSAKRFPSHLVSKPEQWPLARSVILDDQMRIWLFSWAEPGQDSFFEVRNFKGEKQGAGRVEGEVHAIVDKYAFALFEDDGGSVSLRRFLITPK